jgi:hypothetical protein
MTQIELVPQEFFSTLDMYGIIRLSDALAKTEDELKTTTLLLQCDKLQGSIVGMSEGCPIWLKSHYALERTLNIIGNVPSTTSILILQGQNDSQTPVQQAFLLQQALIDKKHPDHTLITYPNLGHVFYPSSEWLTSLGAYTTICLVRSLRMA